MKFGMRKPSLAKVLKLEQLQNINININVK